MGESGVGGGASGAGGEDGGPRPRCHRAAQPCGRRRRARARRRERAAKTSCSQLRSPLPSPPPSPVGPTPSAPARLRNLPPAPTTIVPAHLTPLPGKARAAGTPGPRNRAHASREGGSPAPLGPGRQGRRAERLQAGRILAGRRRGEERCGDRDSRNPGTAPPGNKGLARGGGEGASRCCQTRPQQRIKRVRAAGRLDGETGGLEAERTRKTGKWRARGGPAADRARSQVIVQCRLPACPRDSQRKLHGGTEEGSFGDPRQVP